MRIAPAGLLGDEIQRAGLAVREDLAQVVRDDAEHDELHAAHEEDAAGEEGVAARGGADEKSLGDDGEGDQDAQGDRGGPEPDRESQRRERECGQGFEREPEEFAEAVFRLAGVALVAVVEHGPLLEADPRDEPADEARILAALAEGQHDAAIHESEVARVARDGHVGEPREQAIEEPSGEPLHRGLAGSMAALRIGHVNAVTPRGDKIADHLRRVLQVGVDEDDGIALGAVKAGGRGHLVPEVAAEGEELDTRVAAGERTDRRERAVGAPVIHEDDLVIIGTLAEHGVETLVQRGDIALLVEGGDHNADRQRGGAGFGFDLGVDGDCSRAGSRRRGLIGGNGNCGANVRTPVVDDESRLHRQEREVQARVR